jgi:hypothetical protein
MLYLFWLRDLKVKRGDKMENLKEIKKQNKKLEEVTKAIIEGKIGNLEFIIMQYLSEMNEDYTNGLFKELKRQ